MSDTEAGFLGECVLSRRGALKRVTLKGSPEVGNTGAEEVVSRAGSTTVPASSRRVHLEPATSRVGEHRGRTRTRPKLRTASGPPFNSLPDLWKSRLRCLLKSHLRPLEWKKDGLDTLLTSRLPTRHFPSTPLAMAER